MWNLKLLPPFRIQKSCLRGLGFPRPGDGRQKTITLPGTPSCSSAKIGKVQWAYQCFEYSDKNNPEKPLCHGIQELFLQVPFPIQSRIAKFYWHVHAKQDGMDFPRCHNGSTHHDSQSLTSHTLPPKMQVPPTSTIQPAPSFPICL